MTTRDPLALYGVTQFGDTETCQVANMHATFGFDIADKPTMMTDELNQERYEKMLEELDEFKVACRQGDLAEAADALIDLVVFAKGTAVMMGLPWADLWNDVQRANMTKERGTKPERADHAQDLIKPEGWVGPQTEQILKDAGWEP